MKKTFVFHFVNSKKLPCRIFKTVRFVEDFKFEVGSLYTLQVDENIIAFRIDETNEMCDFEDLKIYFIYGTEEN